jgi:DNA-binding transcriptional LysR family regulator
MSDIDTNNIRRLDGGLLLVFRGLLRRGRTTVVARELGLSQSAVSHALTRLRDVFGDPLFVRRPHGLEPTRRALELGPRIDLLLDQIDRTLKRGAGFDPTTSTRRFSITAPEFVTALIGADLTRAFQREAPSASFAVSFASQERALDALRRGESDVAIARFGTVPAEFASETLFEDEYCVTARKGHPRLRGRISAAQYASIGHVFASSWSESGMDERDLEMPDIACVSVVPRWLSVLVMVAQSDAIGTVPRRLVRCQAKLLGLQVLKPPFVPEKIRVGAVRLVGSADPGIDWLLSRIRAAAG